MTNNQIHLAMQLVKELRKQNMLEDMICTYGIESVRECNYCHRLMNEGWLYADIETYCSDGCLLGAHPEEHLPYLRSHASDEDTYAYWTAFESSE